MSANSSATDELERDVRSACDAGDYDAAATRTLKGYGPEIFGFIAALHRDEGDANDVFSAFSENLWRGLRGFSWQCSLRAWTYTIARNSSHRYRRKERRHGDGRVPLSAMQELANKVRTETLTFLKTEQKDRFAALRQTLPEEDQALLILRVDRKLSWEDLARIMLLDENENTAATSPKEPNEEALKKESARLRKRFQLLKEKLVTLGERAGLIDKRGD